MKALKTVWNVITTVLVALVVVLAILLVGVRVVGLTPYVVLSGSMEPTYHTGSLIYVKKVDPFTIESGTPITFMMDEDTIATHRVVQVVPDETDASVVRFQTKGDANDAVDGSLIHYKNVIGTPITFMMDEDTIATHRVVQVVPDETDASVVRFQTKGDANDAIDGSLVHYKNVIGTPIFSIPYLGYVSNYITNPPGMYIGFTVLGLIILMLFAPDLLKAADAADKKAEAKKKGEHQAE